MRALALLLSIGLARPCLPATIAPQAQSSTPQAAPTPASTDRPPREWAVGAAQNEIHAIQQTGPYLRYRMHIIDRKGDQVRDEIESRDGTVARLILRDGRPLTPAEDTAERARLAAVLDSPEEFSRHIHSDRSNKKLATDLIGLMPDAMLYTYVAGQPQLTGSSSRRQVVLDYAPNPHWSPPTTTAEALTGLHGRIWIDADTQTTVRMDGSIFRSVNFGWGMLAHIYPGGLLQIEQTNAGGTRWIFNHFEEALTVRALLVKSMDIHSKVDASEFQTVSEMSYTDAIHLLLATPLPGR